MLNRTLLRLALLTILLAAAFTARAGGDPVRGETLATTCVTCHGAQGIAIAPNFPSLAGQYADYLAASLRQYQTGERKDAIMAGFVVDLSEQDIKDLAAFYASKPGLSILPLND